MRVGTLAASIQGKNGADGGIDGMLPFRDDNSEAKINVIQVKSDKLTFSAVRRKDRRGDQRR